MAANPLPVQVSPASGNLQSQAFTFEFSDTAGWANITTVNALVNFYLDGASACYLSYNNDSQLLYLRNDTATAVTSIPRNSSGTFTGTLSNNQCVVNGSSSSVSGSGNVLTLNLLINFSTSFSGSKIMHLASEDRDSYNNNSGWQRMGVWQVPPNVQSPVAVVGMSPTRSVGLGGQTTFTFSDTNGLVNLSVINVLVNPNKCRCP